jgi:hypothetical protein
MRRCGEAGSWCWCWCWVQRGEGTLSQVPSLFIPRSRKVLPEPKEDNPLRLQRKDGTVPDGSVHPNCTAAGEDGGIFDGDGSCTIETRCGLVAANKVGLAWFICIRSNRGHTFPAFRPCTHREERGKRACPRSLPRRQRSNAGTWKSAASDSSAVPDPWKPIRGC